MNFLSGGQLPASPPAVEHTAGQAPRAAPWWGAAGAAALLGLALLWCYGTTLLGMMERWSTDPQYSHGFLVPCFAAVVLWFRRPKLASATWTPSLWGLPLLVAGLGLRLLAIQMDLEAVDAFSLLPSLAGVVLFVGGTGVLAWSWPAIAFLGFMLPLPFSVEMALAHPLRRIATVMSTYVLQTMGYPALHEGNVIVIDELRMGVIDACSGLGMLVTFFALATAVVLVIPAANYERVVLVASAIPIALIANVVRIVITGMAFYATGDPEVQARIHDVAGWLIMMPLALLLFWFELWFLGRLFVAVEKGEHRPVPLWGMLPPPEKEPSSSRPSA